MSFDHWIKHNATTTTPNRHIWLDCEAHEHRAGDNRVQTWRLACTALDRRENSRKPWRETQWQTHYTPADLWEYVDRSTKRRARTVVWAHNLGYDLRISQALDHLDAYGWAIHRLAVHDKATSAVLRRDGRSLVLADTWSWLPMALNKVGALLGMDKVPLPAFSASNDVWEARCRQDVAIMRAAMLDLLGWIEREDLGNFQRTGAAQVWATWRHRFYSHKILVHSDTVAREAEAEAIHTGRCEAWRHGRLPRGQWTEWDLPLCYATVAQSVNVPTRLQSHQTWGSIKQLAQRPPLRRSLCRAEVHTDHPVLPVKTAEGICWPVGDLAGWWWDCELLQAAEYGATVKITEAYNYRAAPALKEWADWVIPIASGQDETVSAIQQAAAKHWSRALIGRFATRFTKWQPNGAAHPDAAPLEIIIDIDTGLEGRVLTLGSSAFVGFEKEWGADTVPAIMGVIMAEARCRLWQALNVAGLENVAYCDTDSLLVNAAGSTRLMEWIVGGGGYGLRVKGSYRGIAVLGPRQLVFGAQLRAAGIPKGAVRHDRHVWVGETWQSLPEALAKGYTDRVIISPRVWHLRGVDHRRVHLPDGLTAPMVMGWHVSAPELQAAG